MRLGVLTGGGDCPGLNAVIRVVVKTAIADGLEVFGILDGFQGLVEDAIIPLNLNSVAGILPKGGTILGTSNRYSPFNYGVTINGKTEYADKSDQAIYNMKKYGIDGLIIIGGDGTMTIAHKFAQKGVKVVGVPKTIDNDLAATDVTFGFDSAVTTATEAVDKLHSTAESHHRIMLVEVMGRDSGWIALHAGIAGGADVILIPEIPFGIESICQKFRDREKYGRRFSIVVAAEGAVPQGGSAITAGVNPGNVFNPKKLGGIAQYVQGKILETCPGYETRVTVLGHLQRGGSPTSFDRILGTRYGMAAVRALTRGDTGTMVCLNGENIGIVPIDQAIRETKKVPVDGELVQSARSLGIGFGD